MALFGCTRFGSKPVLTTLNRFPSMLGSLNYAQAATPKIVIKKFEEPKVEHHDIRNERLKRPLSPHLTIYAFPLPAMMSITHRATGIMLSGYFSALGIGALVLPHDISHYISIIESMNLSPATLFLAKVVLAAPFGYHFANGVRHLYWDTAKGLAMKEIYTTSYGIMGLAAVITLVLAAL
ncbi:succinate dehydrogenase cytochrome b560 subunit, mitochondrial-like [Anticarsia gemmatalis]|uniref:succinate dehydrogenase cytochrome b560 subunit, mitochondrial-like n=1 Tax=Anticarsia gemmatalis TaxID=129554 RepID=UPI003F75F6C4